MSHSGLLVLATAALARGEQRGEARWFVFGGSLPMLQVAMNRYAVMMRIVVP